MPAPRNCGSKSNPNATAISGTVCRTAHINAKSDPNATAISGTICSPYAIWYTNADCNTPYTPYDDSDYYAPHLGANSSTDLRPVVLNAFHAPVGRTCEHTSYDCTVVGPSVFDTVNLGTHDLGSHDLGSNHIGANNLRTHYVAYIYSICFAM